VTEKLADSFEKSIVVTSPPRLSTLQPGFESTLH